MDRWWSRGARFKEEPVVVMVSPYIHTIVRGQSHSKTWTHKTHTDLHHRIPHVQLYLFACVHFFILLYFIRIVYILNVRGGVLPRSVMLLTMLTMRTTKRRRWGIFFFNKIPEPFIWCSIVHADNHCGEEVVLCVKW